MLLFSFRPGEEAPSSPHHHFHLDGARRGRSSSRRRFLFQRGEEVYPSSSHHHSHFDTTRRVCPSSSCCYSRFDTKRRVYPSSSCCYSCFENRRSKEVCPPFRVVIPISMKRRSTPPLRILTTPISTRQVGYHPTTLTYVIKCLYINCI